MAAPTAAWSRLIETFSETVALTVGALIPIMNPFSTAPLFLSLTTGMDPAGATSRRC